MNNSQNIKNREGEEFKFTKFNEVLILIHSASVTENWEVGGKVYTPYRVDIRGPHQNSSSFNKTSNSSILKSIQNKFEEAYLVPVYSKNVKTGRFQLLLVAGNESYITSYNPDNFVRTLAHGLTVDYNGRFNQPISYCAEAMWVPDHLLESKSIVEKLPPEKLVVGGVYKNKMNWFIYLGYDENKKTHRFVNRYERRHTRVLKNSSNVYRHLNKSDRKVVLNGLSGKVTEHVSHNCNITFKNFTIVFYNPDPWFSEPMRIRIDNDRIVMCSVVEYSSSKVPILYNTDCSILNEKELYVIETALSAKRALAIDGTHNIDGPTKLVFK